MSERKQFVLKDSRMIGHISVSIERFIDSRLRNDSVHHTYNPNTSVWVVRRSLGQDRVVRGVELSTQLNDLVTMPFLSIAPIFYRVDVQKGRPIPAPLLNEDKIEELSQMVFLYAPHGRARTAGILRSEIEWCLSTAWDSVTQLEVH